MTVRRWLKDLMKFKHRRLPRLTLTSMVNFYAR
jgi:hypothetical protein